MSDLAIRTRDLTKRYGGRVLAVDRVSLTVARGELYAFLGLNGAGKSTTIRILLGMISPTAGTAEVLGRPVRADDRESWSRVGHLVDVASAYPELSVRENLDVARRLHGIRDPNAIARVIDLLGLTPYRDRPARALSLGNLQRLSLARALLHRPDLLVLDEPANGLDPAGVVEIRGLLRDLVEGDGVTVFMSSHILSEVDLLATRIGIVHGGRLIEELDRASLARHRDPRLEVRARDLERAAHCLRQAGFSPVTVAAQDHLELRDAGALERPDDVARILVEAGMPPTHLAVTRDTLENHFMRLTGSVPA